MITGLTQLTPRDLARETQRCRILILGLGVGKEPSVKNKRRGGLAARRKELKSNPGGGRRHCCASWDRPFTPFAPGFPENCVRRRCSERWTKRERKTVFSRDFRAIAAP